MNAPTYTVQSGYTDRAGNHWVFVKDHPHKLSASEPYPEGTAVRVVEGRAVK